MCILANNFICRLNYFLRTHLHHPSVHFQQPLYEAIGHNKLDVLWNTLNLTNLVKSDTCYTNDYNSTIDLFLTNKPSSFQFTTVTETGLSNYHKPTTTFINSHFSRLKPEIIHYRNFKRFDEKKCQKCRFFFCNR